MEKVVHMLMIVQRFLEEEELIILTVIISRCRAVSRRSQQIHSNIQIFQSNQF